MIRPDLSLPIPESITAAHFIGIGGSGMSGLAKMFPDAAGNWSENLDLVWDAWGRLVSVSDGSGPVGTYAYDALHRRTRKTAGGQERHFYYSDSWQVLEERTGSSPGTLERQYLWGALPGSPDNVVYRKLGTGQRYVLHDAFNVTAVAD